VKRKLKQEKMKLLRNVAGYTRKDQTRNTTIREELNVLHLNAEIIIFRSQWKYHLQRMESRRIPKKILTYNPKTTET
jgi:hypothetical protein